MQRRYMVCLCACLAFLLAACGGQPAAIPTVALPQGWQSVREEALVFALPPAWEVVNAADGNFEGALDDLSATNPQLATVAAQGKEALSSGQIALMAFDLDQEHVVPTFTTNLSVGQSQLERIASLDEVGSANEQQLTANGFTNVERNTVRIGTREVVRLRSSLAMQSMSDEPLDLALEQYIVVVDQQQYVLTFTTAASERERMRPIFEQIAGTLQVE